MNKNQGATLGAVVLAGLLLRPIGAFSPPRSGSSDAGTPLLTSSDQMKVAGEGPWIASCKYWAPAREKVDKELPEGHPLKPGEIRSTLDEASGEVDWHLHATARGQELDCGGHRFGRWGFPQNNTSIKVTAIIATVPDPVHTHLAMAFDRTVDALLQAASDNDYVSSYYWLPWKTRAGAIKTTESPGDAESGQDPERERKPGLIVLKHVSSEGINSSLNFYEVIYLFLVAETPTQGVDGFQMRNAFLYEDDLDTVLTKSGNRFSRGRINHTAIIGPIYSGSAASLRVAADTEAQKRQLLPVNEFDISGATETSLALNLLNTEKTSANLKIHYFSFADSADYDERAFLIRLMSSGYEPRSVALLIEDNTVLGNAISSRERSDQSDQVLFDQPLVIRFPREISLLRNAQVADDQSTQEALPSGSHPSPYLHLSLKDSSADDGVPHFSPENTPLSQEAQLMTIARQLHRFRSQFIAIVASNPLDQIFLAQFLHRACPDARLVFFGGDLLMEREVDNVPFIGTVTVTPYNLIGLGRTSRQSTRAYPDSASEAYYNAATYSFWTLSSASSRRNSSLPLKGYQGDDGSHPLLWATAIGADGYYPLAILSRCASDSRGTLPAFDKNWEPQRCMTLVARHPNNLDLPKLRSTTIYPSLTWVVLCTLVSLLCFLHLVFLCVADYWSPFTRDLAIQDNDQPRRRSMYIQVGMVMLFCMAFVISYPAMSISRIVTVNAASMFLSCWTLSCGLSAVALTVWKTRRYILWEREAIGPKEWQNVIQHAHHRIRENIFFLVDLLAWVALIGVPILWGSLCSREWVADWQSYVGLMFSYRCLNPGSGVSPVVPVLLLLFSWYLWAFYQTWRLRFSDNGRPWLPGKLSSISSNRLFVSDEDLDKCGAPQSTCLYENITSLFITRQIVRRLRQEPGKSGGAIAIDILLVTFYLSALSCFSFLNPIRSIDHFLWNSGRLSSPYEFLVGVLSLPLIMIALAGWLRMILIWGALKRGLLERLENQPIRFAFSRLRGMGWMTMLRRGGLHEQWRDMARSIESIRQILHESDVREGLERSHYQELETVNANLLATIGELRSRIDQRSNSSHSRERNYDSMRNIEKRFAEFGESLLSRILIPYWENQRSGLVDSGDLEELPIKGRRSQMYSDDSRLPLELHAAPASSQPIRVTVAEEFLVIRYVSLIRAVLANLRYLMTFVSSSFVLAIVAWNSYPFQPRQQVDWLFTGLLLFLGSGVIWVFVQMYRDPILSRITDTKPNELGWEFYIRIISFGTLPLLTWLAYQFPDIGSVIFHFLQPGIGLPK